MRRPSTSTGRVDVDRRPIFGVDGDAGGAPLPLGVAVRSYTVTSRGFSLGLVAVSACSPCGRLDRKPTGSNASSDPSRTWSTEPSRSEGCADIEGIANTATARASSLMSFMVAGGLALGLLSRLGNDSIESARRRGSLWLVVAGLNRGVVDPPVLGCSCHID